MIKPDGTSRQLVGKIISRFEEKGYKLVGEYMRTFLSGEVSSEHNHDRTCSYQERRAERGARKGALR
jgi:nucleoside diphosphate kinase